MSGFAAFLLAVFALLGLAVFFFTPLRSFEDWAKGKTQTQMTDEIKDRIDKATGGEIAVEGFRWGCFILANLLLTYIVHPIYILSAITGNVGNQYFAYTAGFVVAVSWLQVVRGVAKASTKKGVAIKTDDGRTVTGELVIDEPYKGEFLLKRVVRRAFFALPIAYTAYLFLFAINLVK